jgi:hypothetical protein
MLKHISLRRSLPAARIVALGVVAAGALLGAHSLHGAQAKSPVSVIYQIAGPATATAGQTVSYTINIANPNGLTATDIDIDLHGQDSAIMDSYTTSAGMTCTASTFPGYIGEECKLASMAPGDFANLTIVVTLTNASAPTYEIGGVAAAAGYLTLVKGVKTIVTPAAPSAPAAQPYVPAPNYNGRAWDPNAGPNGGA